MKRRLYCALAAFALLATGWCRPASATDISFYFPVAVGGPVARLIGELVGDFQAGNPDIRVTPIYAGTYKDTLAKALTADRSGTPPTAAVLFAVDVYTLIDAGVIVSYDELLAGQDKSWLEGFYPALVANGRVAGKLWGVPFQRSTILLYWNKRAFAEAGLDPERPPANWHEMTEYARRLTHTDARGSTRWGLQIPSSGFPYWLFQGLATANGVQLMNAAGTRTDFDAPGAVEALRYWVELSRLHRVHPPGIVEWGSTPADFVAGRAAMIWTTSGNLASIRSEAAFDFGVAMLPAKARRGSPTGGGNLYIFRKSSPLQREAALRFVKWLAEPAQTARWSIHSGYIAVRPEAWDTEDMKRHVANFPMARVSRDQLEFAVAELSTHENQRVTRALNRGLVAALTGAKTPEQALADAQAEARRILLPYQR